MASVNTDNNSSVVTLQSGDQVIAKWSGESVSTRVLIADGEIRGSVPALPYTALDLF